MLLDGLVVLAVGSVLANAGFYDASQLVGAIGAGAILLGIILLGLTILLYREPESSLAIGIAILVFSLLALLTGGGFLLGTILGTIGGIAAIAFNWSEDEEGGFSATQPLPPAPGWTCAQCRRLNTYDVWYCGQCGNARPKAGPAGLW